jgi:hypothetical protein
VDRGVFVGRADELAVLERHLAAAREAEGGLVLVDGEAGMVRRTPKCDTPRLADRHRQSVSCAIRQPRS